ncbi:filamentous hemagglutinin N-terminal domain-containing protein [Guyparkeria sp. TX1]|uniref:two-partner secretion domain-containing protein n=1 Tax=Guyparkeria sp. TX1 TaxID=3115001 RepID=UPI003977C452
MLAMLVTPTLSASEIRSHPDAHGGNRPSIHQSGNGTPVVDITTPGTDGVSHNVYQQLDVDERGVVFNNGRQTSATTLAGQIGANPALAGGTADLILNEVRAASPSQLAGYLEIGGDPADLVIANPAGITCNGCGFINAERAMLTTGKPRFDDGRWSGLDVRGGRIRVEGDGMDASRTAQADLLARAIEINAGIWADEVNVITGVGQFDLRGRLVGSAATDLPPPDWSIDTGQLGGMYANKIRLVANEHGVGVRNRGSLQAGSTGLILMTDGQLVNRGILHSEARARLDGSSIDNHGTLQATDQLTVTSTKAFTNQGGRLSSGADLTLAASSIENDGTLQAGEDITLVSDGRLTNHQGQILAERDITVAARRLDNRGEIHANGTLEIQVASTLSNQSILTAVDSMHLTASNALNRGELLTGNDLHLLLDADLDNATGRIRVGREANVSASSFDNQDGLLLAGRAMGLEADRIDNTGGTIGSAGSLQASSRTLDNSGGELQAGDGLTLDTITLSGAGRWSSTTDLTIHVASDYDHEGELLADEDLSLDIDGELTNSGTFSAAGAATLRADGVTNRADGKIVAGQLSLDASERLDNHGLIDGGQVSLTATHVINHPGARLYGTDLSITAATLRNLGDDTQAATLAARDQMRLTIDTLENRDEALILSVGDMAIAGREGAPAGHLLNDGSTIEALGVLAIEADRIENRNAGLVTAQVDEAPVRESWIQLRGSQRTFDAVACSNLYDENVWCQGYPHEISDFTWFRTTAITSHTEVVRTEPAVIRAGDDMTLVGDKLVNTDSQIIAGGELHAELGELDNSATQGQDITRRSGTASFTTVESCGTFGSDHCREWHGTSAYNPAPVYSARYDLPTVTYTERAGANSLAPTLPSPASGSGSPLPELPQASLFRLKLDNPNAPLVETDPRFASYRQWYGSQAMLDALARDPAYTQKRLGDAFYEQALVREQVIEQTGQRRLAGFADDEAQFRALIDAGITLGKDLELTPGVRLKAEQLAQLTADIVWLEEQDVSIDGQSREVLIPRLHLADGAPRPAGNSGRIAAQQLQVAVDGSATNRGDLAARDTLTLSANRIENLGGTIEANRTHLAAGTDIQQRGGEIRGQRTLSLAAGRDITVEADTRRDEIRDGTNHFSRDQIVDRGRIAVTGDGELTVTAGRDLTLQAAEVTHDGDGATTLSAGRDLRLTTTTEGHDESITWDADNRLAQGTRREVGAVIDTQSDLKLIAGRDLSGRAANIDGGDDTVTLTARRDIQLADGEATRHWEEAHRLEDDSWASSTVAISHETANHRRSQASRLSGGAVRLSADQDIAVQGSHVDALHDLSVLAGDDIRLLAGEERHEESHVSDKQRSGFTTSGYNRSRRTFSREEQQIHHVASSLHSRQGDVTLLAGLAEIIPADGGAVVVDGSRISADAGRLDLAGQHILLTTTQDSTRTKAARLERKSTWAFATGLPEGAKDSLDAERRQLTANGSTLSGREGVSLLTNGLIDVTAARLESSDGGVDINGGQVHVRSARDKLSATRDESHEKTGVSWRDLTGMFTPGQGVGYDTAAEQVDSESTLVPATINGRNVTIRSMQDDIDLAAVRIEATGDETEQAGVRIDAAGDLYFGTLTTETFHRRDETHEDLAWQGAEGEGRYHEQIHYNRLNAERVKLGAGDRVTADITSHDPIETLARTTGMDWLRALRDTPSLTDQVDWQAVKEAHEHWSYDEQGLTPAASTVVAALVTYFTAGAGTSIVNAAAGTGAATTTTGTIAASIVEAAVTNLATEASISFINNEGDITKALNEIGDEETLRTTVSSMLSAGINTGFGNSYGVERFAVSAASGCAKGRLSNESCRKGAIESATMSGLQWTSHILRQNQLNSSKKFSGICDANHDCISNISGSSVGVDGDNVKLGGGRINVSSVCEAAPDLCNDKIDSFNKRFIADNGKVFIPNGLKMADGATPLTTANLLASLPQSPLGGLQGGGGVFGMFNMKVPYEAGSFLDILVESFAGPHDWLNSSHYYGANGNINTAAGIWGIAAWNSINVALAAPFGLATLCSQAPVACGAAHSEIERHGR